MNFMCQDAQVCAEYRYKIHPKACGKNYIRRPLDLLRVHHEKIEAWILEQAGIVFDAKAAPGALRVVG